MKIEDMVIFCFSHAVCRDFWWFLQRFVGFGWAWHLWWSCCCCSGLGVNSPLSCEVQRQISESLLHWFRLDSGQSKSVRDLGLRWAFQILHSLYAVKGDMTGSKPLAQVWRELFEPWKWLHRCVSDTAQGSFGAQDILNTKRVWIFCMYSNLSLCMREYMWILCNTWVIIMFAIVFIHLSGAASQASWHGGLFTWNCCGRVLLLQYLQQPYGAATYFGMVAGPSTLIET